MSPRSDSLSNADLGRLCELIYAESGIKLTPDKRVMLEMRLKRRLQELEIGSYREYCDFLFAGQHQDQEIVHLIDVVTTNKTDFFREGGHFEVLAKMVLPEYRTSSDAGREFRVWSAGCSTGEEPYTLAMVLQEFGESNPGFRFKILATDISNTVLAKAEKGVFGSEVIQPVPTDLRRKYFMRSRDPNLKSVRVVPELRSAIEFRRLNLMEEFGLNELMDAIFCRNVIIYFDRATQESLLKRMSRQLVPGGYMFMGHSEALHNMDIALTAVAPALYRKANDRTGA
jgi:chemotaxis protein methyltransferase CheR